ncbi:MAG: hypothetical protein ABIQ93_01735 [Saprospiraceae bacterium]
MEKSKNVGDEWPEEEPYSLVKLRELIVALDMSEKNVFKRHIRSHSASNHESSYIQLFDCVNDCLVEAERKARKQVAVTEPSEGGLAFYPKFIALYRRRKISQQRAVGPMANYLYERILDALRNQNAENNPRLELYARLLDIQLLLRKGLQRECLSMIQYAKKLAMNLEALPQLFELTQIEFRLVFNSKKNQTASQLRELYAAESRWLRQLERMIQLKDLRYELLLVLWEANDVEDDKELRAKLNFFIQYVNDAPPRETFDEEFNFQTIMASLIWINQKKSPDFLRQFLSVHQPESLVNHFKTILELYNRYPDRKYEDPRRYRDNLINYLGVAIAYEADINMADYSDELDSIPVTDPDYLRSVVYIRLIDYIKHKNFAGAKAFLQHNNVWQLCTQPNHQASTSRLQVIRYLSGLVCFVRGDYQQAAHWFDANLQKTDQPSNAESQSASALYHLLARVELGFAARNIYRELLQPLREYLPDGPFVQRVISTMEKILRSDNKPETLREIAEAALPDLREEMTTLAGSSHFGLFIGWLESKRQQRPLRVTIEPFI